MLGIVLKPINVKVKFLDAVRPFGHRSRRANTHQKDAEAKLVILFIGEVMCVLSCGKSLPFQVFASSFLHPCLCLSPPAPDDIPLQVFRRMHGCDTIKVSQSVYLSLHTLWTILLFFKETFFGIYGRTYCPCLNASSAVTISTPPLPSGVIQLCIPTFH